MGNSTPSPENIGPDTPLRLQDAVRLAFPAGGMTVSGLRTEATRGRLKYWRIAGKIFTTLAAIAEMREQCRVQPKEPVSGSALKSETSTARSANARCGSSETDRARSARAALQKIARAPSARSAITLQVNTGRTEGAVVIPLKS